MKVADRHQKGFSLVELLVTIVIMGIMAGMASIGFDMVRRERITSTTKELLTDIQKVRMDAMVTGPSGTGGSTPNLRGFGVRFDSATSYVTFAFNDSNGDFAYSGTSEEVSAKTRTIASSITLEISSDPAFTVLIYDRFGAPKRYKSDGSSPASNLVVLIKDTSISNVKCVSINTNGIRGGAWNAGTCVEQ